MTSKERDRDKFFAEMGVTAPEVSLLIVINYGPKSSGYLTSLATSRYYSCGPVTEEESRAALASCLAKGLLQVIDEAALAKIADNLREGQYLGPIYRLPGIGDVDFTPVGAELWHRLRSPRRPDDRQSPFAYPDVVHSKTSQFFKTRSAALAGIQEAREWDEDVSVVGPIPIGPWRAQWWRRFSEGYRIDIEARRQWHGAIGAGEGCSMPNPSQQGGDPQRLRDVLDRHNIALGEWLLLAAVDCGWCISASHLSRRVAENADQLCGVTASEDECRAGLEASLRFGWLRALDQQAVAEVVALLRDDPVLLPVPCEVMGRGQIDFTPTGATLYRMIAAEWIGPDWEDALSVWKETYREEHRYCVAEEGFGRIVEELALGGEVVRASKVVPIGPWCVYWWQRYQAGYRMEFEIGERGHDLVCPAV